MDLLIFDEQSVPRKKRGTGRSSPHPALRNSDCLQKSSESQRILGTLRVAAAGHLLDKNGTIGRIELRIGIR